MVSPEKRARSGRTRVIVATVVAVALLALSASIVGGCGQSQNPQTGKLIQESNAHLSKAASEVKSLGDFNAQGQALLSGTPSTETATKMKALLEKARTSEKAALEEIKGAEEAISKIKDLPVGSEMKTYADMKLQALQEQEQVLVIELKAMDLRQQAMDSILAGSTMESVLMIEKQIDALEQESIEQAKNANELHTQANAYFEEKKLGK